jgi:hypothetical protein
MSGLDDREAPAPAGSTAPAGSPSPAPPDEAPPVVASALRDRTGFLGFLGVVEIIIGAFVAILGLMSFVGTIAGMGNAGEPRQLAAARAIGVFFYCGAAAFLILVGIGTIRIRRWARALMLVASWSMVAGAIPGLAFAALILTRVMQNVEPAGSDPTLVRVLTWTVMGVVGFFMIAMPFGFALAYNGRHVRHTFATKHPERSWVDGRPTGVLAVGLLMILFGVLQAAGSSTGLGVLFGVPLQGLPAIAANLVIAGAWVGLGWGILALRRRAWIASFLFVILVHASAYLTYRHMSFLEMGYRLGWDAGQATLLNDVAPLMERGSGVAAVAFGVAWLASLLALRRHFAPRPVA